MPEDHYLNEAEVLRENGNQVVPPWALNPLLTRWVTAKTAALEAEVRTKFRLPTELREVLYKIESEAMGKHELDQHIFAYQFTLWQHPFTIISCYTYITRIISLLSAFINYTRVRDYLSVEDILKEQELFWFEHL
jgi:hypothetical protein